MQTTLEEIALEVRMLEKKGENKGCFKLCTFRLKCVAQYTSTTVVQFVASICCYDVILTSLLCKHGDDDVIVICCLVEAALQ